MKEPLTAVRTSARPIPAVSRSKSGVRWKNSRLAPIPTQRHGHPRLVEVERDRADSGGGHAVVHDAVRVADLESARQIVPDSQIAERHLERNTRANAIAGTHVDQEAHRQKIAVGTRVVSGAVDDDVGVATRVGPATERVIECRACGELEHEACGGAGRVWSQSLLARAVRCVC